MATRSPKWKWFSFGCAISLLLSILGTYFLIDDKLAQSATDPVLAPPPLAVGASVLMTFFSLLIPAISLCGVVIVIVDGYTRKTR
jgi:hypothetical protein